MSLSEKRYLHHCSLRSKKNQWTWDKPIILVENVCCQFSPTSHEQVRGDPCTNQVQICLKMEIKSRPGKQANQDSPWKSKRANSCWSQLWDPEARTSHCTFRSEKQVRACCRFITRKRESLFQRAQSILASTERPVTLHPLSKGRGVIACFAEPWSYTVSGCHKNANLTKS